MTERKPPKTLIILFAAAVALGAVLMGCANKEAVPPARPAGVETPSAAKPSGAPAGKVSLELFVMSQCPFGKGAEGVIEKV